MIKIIYCDDAPADLAPGWYPGVSCWEEHEGGIPCGLHWDGSSWDRTGHAPFQYIAERFDDEAGALARAYELELGW